MKRVYFPVDIYNDFFYIRPPKADQGAYPPLITVSEDNIDFNKWTCVCPSGDTMRQSEMK